VFQEGRMLLFSPLGQCRVEPCDFDPNEVWTSCKHTLGQKCVTLPRAGIENNGGIFAGAPRSAYVEFSIQL
jgi:hypothetical protein